ncbi:MAG: hypothetical protein ABI904_03385 [Chloroflexota bacterium]
MSIFVKNIAIKKNHIAALFLGVSAIIGIVRFIIFVVPRSKPEDQLILGLSAARVFLGVIFLGLLLINIGATLFMLLNLGPWQKQFEKKTVDLFSQYHTIIMLVLYAALILIGTFLVFMLPPILRPLRFLIPFHIRLSGFLTWIFVADLLLIILLWVVAPEALRTGRGMAQLNTIFACVILLVVTFVLYFHTAILIGWINKSTYMFWDLLAGQFIQGKLYLENPPYTHDLTLYNGKWYVPMPPLPGILLMPVAYWFGAENISTSYFSMFFSAMNGVLMLLILKQLAHRKWIELSGYGMFWLVLVFLFGTPHLWVGISGRGWYVSQILTVLFLALAIYAALCAWPAWASAAFIGFAMLARPNSLMTWPFVFAISMQIIKENQGSVTLKQALKWVVTSALPIAIAVLFLLGYNYLRFDNFLDFGYTTITGDPEIVKNVQTYGLFSTHFIPNNAYVMLFKMPVIHWGIPWPTEPKGALWPIDPTTTGMSIFLTTPPLLYLFRRYPKQWWILGAWVAVLFNLIMLSCYSNAGAHQFGYRYILDFLIPLIAMLAVGLGKKVPWQFILLTLLSILINLYGAYWFMNG